MGVEKQPLDDTYNLIGSERVKKLDLLVKLISNQREPLIVCGAEGIGKTTLLKALTLSKNHLWAICFFQGTEPLSFGDIKRKLGLAIKAQRSTLSSETLEDMLVFYEEHQQKIVLILDNAGRLPSGFIDKLINYSLKYPAIKIIFALTKQELSLKNKTDIAIDKCYFLEIPVLEKYDIGLFLKMLSTLPNAIVAEEDVNDKLQNTLYQRTNGIPGKIIHELQKQTNSWFRWKQRLIFVGCMTAILTLVYFYIPILEQNKFYKSFFMGIPQIKLEINSKENELKQTFEINNETIVEKVKKKKVVSNKVLLPIIAKSLNNHKKTAIKIKQPQRFVDNSQWVLQQAAKRYTLQLLLTSKKNALLRILKKYPKLQAKLKYVQVRRKNKRLYILFYGSFTTKSAAYKSVKILPREFKQAWPKRFNAIQTEIKKSR